MVSRCLLVAMVAVLAAPTAADGQVLQLAPAAGETGVRGTAASGSGARRLTAAEWLQLRIQGAVLHRDLFRFGLGLRPGLEQSRLGDGTADGGLNAKLLGADAQAVLLAGKPLWAAARYIRLSRDDDASGVYGSDRFGLNSSLSADVHYSNVWMPLQVAYTRESWSQRWADTTAAPATTWETIRLSGASSKTLLSLERRTSETPERLITHIGAIENTQTWGKGSRLLLRLNAQGQRGTQVLPTRNTDEYATVHLQHTRTVSSDWSVGLGQGDVGGQATGRRALEGALTWQAASWLSAGARGNRSRVTSAGAEQHTLRVGPQAALALRLPLGASLTLASQVAYERLRVRSDVDRWIVVVGETQAIDQAGMARLSNPHVDPASVVVRGPEGAYRPGLDYALVETGGFWEIVALPGGRLAAGAVVSVDYRYLGRVSGDAPALWTSHSADLQVRIVRLYHRRWARDPADGATLGPLAGVRYQGQTATGAQVTVRQRSLTGTFIGERREYADGRIKLRSSAAAASISGRLLPRLTTGLRARYSLGTSDTVRTELAAGTVVFDWLSNAALHIGGEVSVWRLTQNRWDRSDEVGGQLRATWEPGLFRAAAIYHYRDWARARLDTGAFFPSVPLHQLIVELTRRF
ncbi:MAG TPA: hypothetical protein VNL18_15020 [Gemmatimonadales bacterium]|nr:hypothetical protein [Gemmatimonadales bacterium]